MNRDPETLARDPTTCRLDQVRSLGPERIDHEQFVKAAAYACQGERSSQCHSNEHVSLRLWRRSFIFIVKILYCQNICSTALTTVPDRMRSWTRSPSCRHSPSPRPTRSWKQPS